MTIFRAGPAAHYALVRQADVDDTAAAAGRKEVRHLNTFGIRPRLERNFNEGFLPSRKFGNGVVKFPGCL
ncbi:hypothetical protein QW131_30020 [Roseibium salinum]|nr:hypothetical protein [Roseibium salinum]